VRAGERRWRGEKEERESVRAGEQENRRAEMERGEESQYPHAGTADVPVRQDR